MLKFAVLVPKSTSSSVYALFLSVLLACEINVSVISGVKNMLDEISFSLNTYNSIHLFITRINNTQGNLSIY